ncbi:MAG: Mur ligase family protein, partial [Patescibacteria group bacterium]
FMQYLLNKIKKIIPVKLFKKIQPIYHFFLSRLSAVIYRHPSEKLIVIGITGTTGKTTSVYLTAKMLEEAGYRVGYTSTAMFSDGKKEWLNDKKMTMPGRFFTQKMLKRMLANKCRYAIIESTSEGMRQFRHRFINYDIVVFTGLYPEHIESHGGFENYKKAKGKLFDHLKTCNIKYVNDEKEVQLQKGLKKLELSRVKKTIVANLEDEHCGYFLDFWAERKMGYLPMGADAGDHEISENVEKLVWENKKEDRGVSFAFKSKDLELSEEKINMKILGDFNIGNSLNAVCIGLAQGLAIKDIKRGLESVDGIPGRLEKIDLGQDFFVVVDYAFEPNALAKTYDTLDRLPHRRIIHVLGSAGGGRDADRRPKLGALAGERGDMVIVANEDPYDEDPGSIIDQVAGGAEKQGKKEGVDLFKIPERQEAIRKAVFSADKDDLVLITGKGSEQGICMADGKIIPWDDRKVAREEIREKMSNK